MIPETIIDSELDKPKSVQEWLEKNEKRNRARRKISVSNYSEQTQIYSITRTRIQPALPLTPPLLGYLP